MGKWERSGGNGIDWHRFSAIHLVGWWGRAESFPRRNRNRQVDSSKSLQKKMTDGQAGLKKRRGQEIARSRVERHDGRRRMNPSGEELSTHCVGIHPTLHHLFSFPPLFFFFFFVSFSFFPFDLLPTCSSRVSCVCVCALRFSLFGDRRKWKNGFLRSWREELTQRDRQSGGRPAGQFD